MKHPKISVLLAVNKLDDFLAESITSVLNQTYDNFELLILCNGPKRNLLEDYINNHFTDKRIKVFKIEMEGVAFARNFGINQSKAKYIALQDADDISMPDRFKKQVEFLELNGDYSLVGSKVLHIDSKGRFLKNKFLYIQSDKNIKKLLPIHNTLLGSSLMMRKCKVVEAKGYVFGYFSEDHDLYLRLAKIPKSKFHNLDTVLCHYRRHKDQMTGGISFKIFTEIAAIHFINLFSRGSLLSLLGIIWVFPPVIFVKRFIKKLINRFF